jgi:mannose/fructose/N-acetylgalactosamine-specific phosphotransferase system component IIC
VTSGRHFLEVELTGAGLPALVVGHSVHFLAAAYLGQRYGKPLIDFFARYYRAALYALIALAILGGIAALVYFKWYKPQAQREAHHKG